MAERHQTGQLAAVWPDDGFDASQDAFYYVRAKASRLQRSPSSIPAARRRGERRGRFQGDETVLEESPAARGCGCRISGSADCPLSRVRLRRRRAPARHARGSLRRAFCSRQA
ncbi:MAG TPA: DUF3604 domain-containing protein [Myxococcales bacterium]|nr:DUF3604 domain-containing protein [Myxococcales bacterium]